MDCIICFKPAIHYAPVQLARCREHSPARLHLCQYPKCNISVDKNYCYMHRNKCETCGRSAIYRQSQGFCCEFHKTPSAKKLVMLCIDCPKPVGDENCLPARCHEHKLQRDEFPNVAETEEIARRFYQALGGDFCAAPQCRGVPEYGYLFQLYCDKHKAQTMFRRVYGTCRQCTRRATHGKTHPTHCREHARGGIDFFALSREKILMALSEM